MMDDDGWVLPESNGTFDEAEYDVEQARKAAISEYDEIALKVNQDFGLIPDPFKAEPEHVEVDPALKMPIDVSGVDLNSPPGFVGQVVDWIDSQCRYPRRKLAVASGICAIGNIGGMSHKDARDNVCANMIVFCVAGSSTGKESVLQAFHEIHRAAGMARALHGGIKSEQELLRNLIEHQAALYAIDEIGIMLKKISNAQTRGGAAYLEGIFGAMMSHFSKSNGTLSVSGDISRELVKERVAELSRAQDQDDEERIKRAEHALSSIDEGLRNPFFSLMGFTTPETFDASVNGEMASQGFIGRSLIVTERDNNPRNRKDFKKKEMPMMMGGRLGIMYGNADNHRVEVTDAKMPVHTDPEADAALDTITEWFFDYADSVGESAGLPHVAMARRGIETVMKLSFILAIPDGTRTIEHVRWAFAYTKSEMDSKLALVYANDNEKTNPESALAARLMGFIDEKDGVSVAVMANRTRLDKAVIQTTLKHLEAEGKVKEVDTKRKHRGKPVIVWKVA